MLNEAVKYDYAAIFENALNGKHFQCACFSLRKLASKCEDIYIQHNLILQISPVFALNAGPLARGQ